MPISKRKAASYIGGIDFDSFDPAYCSSPVLDTGDTSFGSPVSLSDQGVGWHVGGGVIAQEYIRQFNDYRMKGFSAEDSLRKLHEKLKSDRTHEVIRVNADEWARFTASQAMPEEEAFHAMVSVGLIADESYNQRRDFILAKLATTSSTSEIAVLSDEVANQFPGDKDLKEAVKQKYKEILKGGKKKDKTTKVADTAIVTQKPKPVTQVPIQLDPVPQIEKEPDAVFVDPVATTQAPAPGYELPDLFETDPVDGYKDDAKPFEEDIPVNAEIVGNVEATPGAFFGVLADLFFDRDVDAEKENESKITFTPLALIVVGLAVFYIARKWK